jgi:hypothetical protein
VPTPRPFGQQITEIIVLVNERHLNGDGAWVDGEPTQHVAKAFTTLSDNLLAKRRRGAYGATVGTGGSPTGPTPK